MFALDQQVGARVSKRRRGGYSCAATVETGFSILSLHDALPIYALFILWVVFGGLLTRSRSSLRSFSLWARHSAETSEVRSVHAGTAVSLPVPIPYVAG